MLSGDGKKKFNILLLLINADTKIDISDRKWLNKRKFKQQNNYKLPIDLSVTEDILLRISKNVLTDTIYDFSIIYLLLFFMFLKQLTYG